jgi:hypothetical protein
VKPLDPQYATRLVKLLGMCGSDHAGERSAAALKADQLLRAHGMTWAEVITAPAITRHNTDDQKSDWRAMREFCAQRSDQLLTRAHSSTTSSIGAVISPKSRKPSWSRSTRVCSRRELRRFGGKGRAARRFAALPATALACCSCK